MNPITKKIFSLLICIVPLFYSFFIIFPEQVKAALVGITVPILFLTVAGQNRWHLTGVPIPSPFWILIAIVSWVGISITWSHSLPQGVMGFFPWVTGMTIAILVSKWVEQEKEEGLIQEEMSAPFIFLPIIITSGIISIYGFLQFHGIEIWPTPYPKPPVPVATFGNTNHAAEWIAPALIFTFVCTVFSKGKRQRIYLLCLFFMTAYVTVLHVRAGWIAVGGGLLISMAMLIQHLGRKQWLRISTPLFFLLIAVLGSWFSQPNRWKLKEELKANTISVRQEIYQSAWNMSKDKPIHGWGAGSFAAEFPPFRSERERRLSSHGGEVPTKVLEPHNDYLWMLVEYGWIGILLISGLGVWIVTRWKQAIISPTAIAAYAALFSIGIQALFRSPLSNPSSHLVFWIALGILSSETKVLRKITGWKAKTFLASLGLLFVVQIFWYGKNLFAEFSLSNHHETLSEANQSFPPDDKLTQKAGEYIEQSLGWFEYDPLKWEIYSYFFSRRGELEKAKRGLEQTLKFLPHHAGSLFQLAQIEAYQNNLSEALKKGKEAFRLHPENNRIPLALFQWAFQAQKDLEAIGIIKPFLPLQEHALKLKQKGEELIDPQKTNPPQPDRALKYFSAHLDNFPHDAEAWMKAGKIFKAQNQINQSEKYFAQAHRYYGIEHLRASRWGPARIQFRLYLKFSTDQTPFPYLYLASLAAHQKQDDLCKENLFEAKKRGATKQDLIRPGLEILIGNKSWRNLLPD